MSIIMSIANEKGGVGKTTTTFNLAHAFAGVYGLKVLLIDCDAQACLTDLCNVKALNESGVEINTLFSILTDKCRINQAILTIQKKFHLIPSSLSLANSDLRLASELGREQILLNALSKIKNNYDLILMDCGRSVSMVNVNAFVASDFILIPTPTDYLNFFGLKNLYEIIRKIKKLLNPDLKILGILLTRFVERHKVTKEALRYLESNIQDRIFNTRIKEDVKLKEAPTSKLSIFEYDYNCNGSKSYMNLSQEIYDLILK